LVRRYGRKAKCPKDSGECGQTLKESHGHSESKIKLVIEYHQGTPFVSEDPADIQSSRQRLSQNLTQVIVIKSQFQGALRNEKRDSWEKGKTSITLLEDKITRARK
jgi:hypothetical protein